MNLFCKLSLYFLFVFTLNSESHSQTNREYLLKAGIIERFARFSEWPSEMITDTFKIKVIGQNPFEGALEKMFATIKVQNKPVAIEYISTITDINDCHILFISESERTQVEDIINYVKSKPILTIGETSEYIRKGVIINFYETSKGTVHFEISKASIKNSKVKMDIKLLGYAKLVE
jgi:hypothetical protein